MPSPASLHWWGLGLSGCKTTGQPRTPLKFPWEIASVFGRMVEDRSLLLARTLGSSPRLDFVGPGQEYMTVEMQRSL